MQLASGWEEYEILDASSGFRLERWKDIVLKRPDPQVIWQTPLAAPEWQHPHASYHRSDKGGGRWEYFKDVPKQWNIRYKHLQMRVSPTGFKHTGIFPEQAVNWDHYAARIAAAGRPVKVLNLFAYTGGATLACLSAGASVTHVDASRGMVDWARENARLNGFEQKPVRWIVDDCAKFVRREVKRGSLYDAVIMDPPSYGRGPGGEVWKLEDTLYQLLELCSSALSDNPLFFSLSGYTTGIAPGATAYALQSALGPCFGGAVDSFEIGLPVKSSGLALPCGSTAVWSP